MREGYCENNPCKAVKRPRSDDSPPTIFTPLESKTLLFTALKIDPGMIPYLAIGLFAGVRPLEIERLTWADVLEHYIEITAAKAKTRQRRLVGLSDNLKEWLSLGGDLPIINKRKRLTRVIKIVGLTGRPTSCGTASPAIIWLTFSLQIRPLLRCAIGIRRCCLGTIVSWSNMKIRNNIGI